MIPELWACIFSAIFFYVHGAKLPEPEVKIEVLYKPFLCHRKSKYGDILLVHYEGFLESNGTMFHSRSYNGGLWSLTQRTCTERSELNNSPLPSTCTYDMELYNSDFSVHVLDRQQGDKTPVWFTLGIREVIKGWDKGLQNMCAGERRKLTIPPSLGYGKEGKGKIPPESSLIFDIEVVEIRNGPRSHESFQEMDLNDDWKLSKAEVKEYLRKEFEKHGYAPNDTHHEVMVEDIFQKEDEDKDGYISSREFTYKHDEL